MKLIQLGLICAILIYAVSGCVGPDQDASLVPFSTTQQYTNGSTSQQDVVITSQVLLDVDLDVDTITISGASAKLVFKEIDLSIRTNMILVTDSGQLIIGSEACKFTHNVHIMLKGTRDSANLLHPEMGQKFIGVQKGGILEIHGDTKMPWVKLAETVDRFIDVNRNNNGTEVKFHHKNSDNSGLRTIPQGLSLYQFSPSLDFQFFNVYDCERSSGEQKQIDKMVTKLEDIAPGDVVAVSVQNYFNPNPATDLTALWAKLETLANMSSGELLIRNSQKFDAFSLVFVCGANKYNQVVDEQIGKRSTLAIASIDHQGWTISAESSITRSTTSKSNIDLRILSPKVAYPTIKTVFPTGWSVGAYILLTSTDYSPLHGERRKIKAINGSSITLDRELCYRHFGKIIEAVDLRGEVALLSRNIQISGEMSRNCTPVDDVCTNAHYDTHGGHMMFFDDFGAIFVEGAELWHMGMATDKGRYPMHFHMCGNVTGRTAMLKENSIHDTFMRAITVHGSFGSSKENLGVQLIRNVAYNIRGHAFFLEDGVELATSLDGNLGAQVLNVEASFPFATDRNKASVFWITNPKVIMTGNIAAGADGMCIWYTFPLQPVGPSAKFINDSSVEMYQYKEAKYTPLWTFENNTVHSCLKGGMNFDNILEDDDGNVRGCMNYKPLKDPTNLTSPDAMINIVRLTASKNLNFNTWLRGGWFRMIQYGCADSTRGVQLARASNQQMTVCKSNILGRTENAEDADYPDAPDSLSLPHHTGIMMYDGPIKADKCYFNHFQPDPNGSWTAGALGFKPQNLFSTSVASTTYNMKFGFTDSVENRVFDDPNSIDDNNLSTFDGSESATFRDGDGSVTQCTSSDPVPVQIVKPKALMMTEGCKYRDNWAMAVCPHLYGKAASKVLAVFAGAKEDFDDSAQIKRTNLTDLTDAVYEDHTGTHNPQFMVLLGNSMEFIYEIQYSVSLPKKFKWEGLGVSKDMPVIVGICLPENAKHNEDFVLTTTAPKDVILGNDEMIFVNNFEELKADTSMRRVLFQNRMLYIKLQNRNTRNPDWEAHDSDNCPGRTCPAIIIEMINDLPYTKCFNATEEELKSEVDISALPKHVCNMPAGYPEADWGPGDIYKIHNGQWGPWTGWSYCCNKEGETNQNTTKRRYCDSPPPSPHGDECSGPSEETKPCTVKCPVDGVLSEWSGWTDCGCDGKSSGSRTRTRTCSVANGGKMCHGALTDIKSCNGGCVVQ